MLLLILHARYISSRHTGAICYKVHVYIYSIEQPLPAESGRDSRESLLKWQRSSRKVNGATEAEVLGLPAYLTCHLHQADMATLKVGN